MFIASSITDEMRLSVEVGGGGGGWMIGMPNVCTYMWPPGGKVRYKHSFLIQLLCLI